MMKELMYEAERTQVWVRSTVGIGITIVHVAYINHIRQILGPAPRVRKVIHLVTNIHDLGPRTQGYLDLDANSQSQLLDLETWSVDPGLRI